MEQTAGVKPITGMASAVEAAKNAKSGINMAISARLVIEMAERITELERVESAWEETMNRLVGEDRPLCVEREINKLKAQAKSVSQLDQFAMAALTLAHEQVQGLAPAKMKEILGLKPEVFHITGEQVRQAVAITAYMMAEAMQAESQKRQGGAV